MIAHNDISKRDDRLTASREFTFQIKYENMKTENRLTPPVPKQTPDEHDGLPLDCSSLKDKHHICNDLQPALWYFLTSFHSFLLLIDEVVTKL